ncbi:ABC transporter ATP-binding protein [Saccharothrix violaceirubra]|uniref:Peptide/nickel transport system ATP-binding protein n=1 Tax=Saccharothrix violaceirubra TaxID=413306 RepID=A0A7W7T662_9PSEU|nr:ABC transporter ATP-binding protein [Saccharothrix violaceirubra]MBB4967303.1 peptide/nickel transport system ATP-binding protein [Saccharothrix violaceirubra]
MTPVLEVRDLCVSYVGRTGVVDAVTGAGFVVERGTAVALVGESGSGKTTIARAITGLLPPSARVSGTVELGGRSLVGLSEKRLRALRGRVVSLVPQDPTAALNPVVPVGAQVAEALLVHDLAGRREARVLATALLTAAGLPDAEARARQYPHELSGGMRQRVLIAMALACGPELIVADEPTSSLDPTVRALVLDHLAALTERSGTALVLITHDLAVAARRAGHLVVLSGGTVVEQGPPTLLDVPAHPVTKALAADAPALNPARLRPSTATDEVLLEVESLTKVYAAARSGRPTTAVEDVSFTVRKGETVALVGESGAGKSTLARLLLRLDDPTSGRIRFAGRDLAGLRSREFRRRIQLVFQDPFSSLDPRYTAAELIAEPLRAFGIRDRSVAELADRVALPPALLRRRPAELSGGQCQRVAIARALAPDPDLVVCDEPASALDVSVQAQVLRLLADLQQASGLAVVFISHDLAAVRQVADRVAVLRSGRVVELGPADRVLVEPAHPYTRTLLEAGP